MSQNIIIVGAGIFGVTAAQALQQRGYTVTVLDAGMIPNPLASSKDITKMIRMDYGDDDFYFDLMEEAFAGWDAWNAAWGEELYHEDGFLIMKKSLMQPGSFELESFSRLQERGHPAKRMSSADLAANHPHWNSALYVDGYTNPRAGWAESGNVVQRITEDLIEDGVNVHAQAAFEEFVEEQGRVVGVKTENGDTYLGDTVIFAVGAWTSAYLPELQDSMWPTGVPVMHFQPENVDNFTPPTFLPWAADISNTGWYGFPKDKTGVVKVANHGKGVPVDPINDPRELPAGTENKFRAFLAETFPQLADAPKVGERLCLYCDTWDGDLWIDQHPDKPGLVVAAGGSGHGFKFAPVLGDIIADVTENKPNRYAERFAWRKRPAGSVRSESARFDG